MESRIARALVALEAIAGAARVEKENEKFVICSESCPPATAVAEHPEVCRLAETLLSEVIGLEVREECDREGSPRCRFEVTGSEDRKESMPRRNSKRLKRDPAP